MRTLLSSLRPSGHLAVVRLPEGATFTARYVDDPDHEDRDITSMVADLLLSGALYQSEMEASGQLEPADTVPVAIVSYREHLVPGQVRPVASFTWAHLPTRAGGDLPGEQVLALIARGIGVEITSGVAAEAAAGQVPDDAGELTDDGKGAPSNE